MTKRERAIAWINARSESDIRNTDIGTLASVAQALGIGAREARAYIVSQLLKFKDS